MPQSPSFEEMTRLPIVYSIPGMDRTSVRRDVVYKTAGGTRTHDQTSLLMDVYSPGGSEKTRLPAVVLIHGGPVPNARPKDWGVFMSYGRLLAASGFAAVTFNHGFSGPERLLDAAADVDGAIAHVRANADGLGIDPDRIALWAFSGGGPFLSAAMRDRPPFVRALVAFYAILDLRAKPPGASAAVTDEMRRDFSPLVHLGAEGTGIAPIFIARAGLDHPLLNGPLDRFVQEALARNLTLEVMNHATGRHGFDILDDDARSREIIARTLDFLKARLQE
jgi:acetyl esterase/lipase